MPYNSAREKSHYYRNKEYYKKKQDRVRAERKQWLLENVSNRCEFCGSTDNLEFDHINPGLKENRVSFLAKGITTLEAQKDNIRVLCHSCHHEHSRAQRKAAFHVFFSLPLEEQNRYVEMFSSGGDHGSTDT